MVFRIVEDPNITLLTFNKGEIDEFRMQPQQFATQSNDTVTSNGRLAHSTQELAIQQLRKTAQQALRIERKL